MANGLCKKISQDVEKMPGKPNKYMNISPGFESTCKLLNDIYLEQIILTWIPDGLFCFIV